MPAAQAGEPAPVGEAGDPAPVAKHLLTFGQAAFGLATLHALLGLALYEPTLFPGGDNAHYMILGDALRNGDGYRDLYLPGTPLHAKYPPGFPVLLAALGWLGGVQLFKIAMLALTTAAVWLTAHVGKRMTGEGAGLLAGGLLAVNPVLLEYGHYVLSEAPFIALVLLSLWSAGRGSARGDALAVAAAVAAFLTRTAGLTLLLAIPLAWLARRRLRPALASGGVAAAVMLLWGLYQRWAAPSQAGYLQELALRDPYDPAAGSLAPAELVTRAAANAWAYVGRILPETLTGVGPGTVTSLLGITLAGLVLVGWLRRARREVGVAEWLVLLYAGLICIWPEVWTDKRFLLPLAPLLLIFAAAGAASLARTADGRRQAERVGTPAVEEEPATEEEPAVEGPPDRDDRPTEPETPGGIGRRGRERKLGVRALAPAALALLVAGPSVVWTAGRIPERVRCVAEYRAGEPCDFPEFASLYAAARWAAANTAPDAVIANRKPTLFYWYSRRKGDLYPYSSDPDVVLRGLEEMGADYVVVDYVSTTTLYYLIPAIETYPLRFEPVYAAGEPPTYILRFTEPPITASRGVPPR